MRTKFRLNVIKIIAIIREAYEMVTESKILGTENKKKGYAAWEELGIGNDFLFGKVMQNAELCKELLQIILPKLQIDHIEYPELQKSIRSDADAKSVRLDVYVKDGKGTVYDIEM
jgi:hypothetical protein